MAHRRQLNEKFETQSIKGAFGEDAYRIAISSTKSMTGHLLGAAGALEAVISTLAIRDQVAPPTINYQTPDPDCDLDYIPNSARKLDIATVMTNSMGFGGHNVSLILTDPRLNAKRRPGEIAGPIVPDRHWFAGFRSGNQSRYPRSCRLYEGCRNLRRALASICRIRSRVMPNSRPTSSSVRNLPSSSPKRSTMIRRSRSLSLSRLRRSAS